MTSAFLRTIALIAIVVSPTLSFAQTLDEKLKEIDEYAKKVRTDWNVPGFSIAIVKDDKVIFAKGYRITRPNFGKK